MSDDFTRRQDPEKIWRIVTLVSAGGEEIDFEEVAGVALKRGYYAILKPVELLAGMEEDEAMVFEVDRSDPDVERYTVVLDDEIIDKVFDEYYEMLRKVGAY